MKCIYLWPAFERLTAELLSMDAPAGRHPSHKWIVIVITAIIIITVVTVVTAITNSNDSNQSLVS